MLREITPFGQIKQAAGPGAGTELDYVQSVVPSTAITQNTEATAITLLTGNSIVCDGSRLKIAVQISSAQLSVTGGRILVLRDGVVIAPLVLGSGTGPFYEEFFDTPPAGSHIYSIKGMSSGANTLTILSGPAGPGNIPPSFMRVTKA